VCLVVGDSLLVIDAAVEGDVDAEGQDSHGGEYSGIDEFEWRFVSNQFYLYYDRFWPFGARGSRRRRLAIAYLGLFRHLQRVVDLNSQVPHGTFEFRVWTPPCMDDSRPTPDIRQDGVVIERKMPPLAQSYNEFLAMLSASGGDAACAVC
jgi:hypothetical protein